MEQQIIDKLMEIKKLYEAGILTKEEMEAEKAKILHSSTSPKTIESKEKKQTEEIAQDAKPLATDSFGHFIFDEPRGSSSETELDSEKESSSPHEIKRNKGLGYISIIILVVSFLGFILVTIAMCGGNRTLPTDDSYDVAVDSTGVDDTDYNTTIDVDDSQEQTPQSYADKAEDYIGGLDTDTRVVASLIDDERHCVYTLTEVEAGWGRVSNLYCHNLETGSTNLVLVPYKVEGEEDNGEQVADAKMVGNNLYVINTSYRCGSSVACLNILTSNWSCIVRACTDAKFVGSNKLKVTYSKLVYEGECLADNQYEYRDKVITLK